MVKTDFLEQMPAETLARLADRALRQTRELGLRTDLFERAELLVLEGQVALSGRNEGQVYDNGWWAHVGLGDCGHCRHLGGRVCAHQLAVAFADLLRRHAPTLAREDRGPSTPGVGVTGRLVGSTFDKKPRKAPRHKGAGDHTHCPRCGGWLTAEGGCNKCGGGR